MADMLLFQGAISGLKAASDIVQGLIGLKVSAEVNTKIIDLQHAIMTAQTSALAAQSEHFSMLQRVRDLEEELVRVKAWEAQKQRYKMAEPFTGCIVYAVQKAMSDGEPPHYICANCYQNGKRSIIQNGASHDGKWGLLVCPVCKTEGRTGYRPGGLRKYAEDIVKPE